MYYMRTEGRLRLRLRSNNHSMEIKKIVAVPALAAVMLVGGAVAGYNGLAAAQAETKDSVAKESGFRGFGRHGKHQGRHGVMGTVSSISGTSITVTRPDGTTYTVEASGAKVQRVVEGALSDIQVGDRIGVRGETSGTTVTATMIMDDMPEHPAKMQ